MNITPLHISLMIHYHAINEPTYAPEVPAVIKYTKELLTANLIVCHPDSHSGYISTERGVLWLKMLQETPFPVLKYIDPRKDVGLS